MENTTVGMGDLAQLGSLVSTIQQEFPGLKIDALATQCVVCEGVLCLDAVFSACRPFDINRLRHVLEEEAERFGGGEAIAEPEGVYCHCRLRLQ